MKLWLLRPVQGLPLGWNPEVNPWEPWYDKCFGFVIRAESEAEARGIAQANAGDEQRDKRYRNTVLAWVEPRFSTCVELSADGERAVVIQDYHSA